MKRNDDKIEIDGENISKQVVELLAGEKGSEDLKDEWIPVAKAIDEPDELPYLISDIQELEGDEELRSALIRVQVNAQLQRKMDLDFYKRQLFAAQTIEVLLFKRLKLKSLKSRKSKKG